MPHAHSGHLNIDSRWCSGCRALRSMSCGLIWIIDLQNDTGIHTPNQVEQRLLAEGTDITMYDAAELVAHNLLSACRERRLLEIEDMHRSQQAAGEQPNCTAKERADDDQIVTAVSDLFPTTPVSVHMDHHPPGILSNVMSPQSADAESCIPLDLTMSVGSSDSSTTQLSEFPSRPELTTLDLTGKLSGLPPDHPSLPQLDFWSRVQQLQISIRTP